MATILKLQSTKNAALVAEFPEGSRSAERLLSRGFRIIGSREELPEVIDEPVAEVEVPKPRRKPKAEVEAPVPSDPGDPGEADQAPLG